MTLAFFLSNQKVFKHWQIRCAAELKRCIVPDLMTKRIAGFVRAS